MEIPQDVIIDTMLNVLGFIAAGGLAVVMYSMVGRQSRAVPSADGTAGSPSAKHSQPAEDSPEGRRRIEFIRLDNTENSRGSSNTEIGRGDVMTSRSRRDRVEVIRLARKMLEAGASAERVQSVLPISDAELTLLSSHTMGTNGGENHVQ